MNSNQSENLDPMILQRLVDGELNAEQVQEVLAQARLSPDQWETIAVGFIENQTWQQAVGRNFADPVAPANVINNDAKTLTTTSIFSSIENQNQQRAAVRWWVIAASLLAAAAIGYMFNQIQNRSLPGDSIAGIEPSSDVEVTNKPELTATGFTPDFHVELPADSGLAGGAQNIASRIPIYRVTNQDQFRLLRAQRAIESEFPRQIMEKLSNSGYQIEQEIEFVSGEVDDQSFVVPIRTIRLIPGQ